VLLIGLTGGIASGKTLVSDSFAELGVPIVDADLLAREAVQPGSNGLNGLIERFGERILADDQSLDRGALRQIIFSDKAAREQVSETRIEQLASEQHLYAIHAIPLLVETKQSERFDKIVVVDVPVSVQIDRLMSRDDTTAEGAVKIIESQASREDRLAIADHVIDNSGSVENTVSQVNALHEHFIGDA